MIWEGIKKVFKEIMSEPGSDDLSWGRVASSFTVTSSITWICYIVFKHHNLDGVDFRGIAEFMTAPYAANKIVTKASEAIQQFSKKD